ncbi:hypothetical protein QCA50_003864 [Cerrena zonata]|uniref:Protein kinase domain-containing protein n=1 Tax=Cerrena zonata TaxID=2478898 RepID=A0AAW0GM75_9APHY
MGAIAKYTTPAFLSNTPYLKTLIETLETHRSANAKCTVCNKNKAVAEHAHCCSTICAREAFAIACQLESALRALESVSRALHADIQRIIHWQGEVAEYAMNVMLAIVANCSHTATQKATRQLLVMLAMTNRKLPSSVLLEGNNIDTSDSRSEGGFGDIYKTTYGGMTVAAKRLVPRFERNDTSEDELEGTRWQQKHEALIWKTLKHKRLLSLSGIIKTDQDYFVISPWHCDGDSRKFLRTMVRDHERYRWGNFYQLFVYRWLLQVVEGLQYLHKQGVIYGDLHSRNVLVVNTRPNDHDHFGFDIVLSDFTFSVIQEADSLQQGERRGGLIRAPEQIHRSSESDSDRPTEKSDVFNFAALCFELYTTEPIYPAMKEHNYQSERDEAISDLKPLDREVTVNLKGNDIPVVIPDELWEIIERCWTVPEDRPTLNWIEAKLKGMQGSISSVQ